MIPKFTEATDLWITGCEENQPVSAWALSAFKWNWNRVTLR